MGYGSTLRSYAPPWGGATHYVNLGHTGRVYVDGVQHTAHSCRVGADGWALVYVRSHDGLIRERIMPDGTIEGPHKAYVRGFVRFVPYR